MSQSYWFLKTGKELTSELADRVDSFQQYVRRIRLTAVWEKNRAFYENRIFGNTLCSDVLDVGEVGELKATTFNHFRNIIRHMLNGLTAATPAYDVSAINTDVSSRRATKIGRGLVDYYYHTKRVKNVLHKQAEKALVYGDGFVSAEFNPSEGRTIRNDETGRFIREGEFQFGALSPMDVFYDPTKPNKKDWEWVTFRRRRNKYSIAALFPKQKDEIEGLEISFSDDLYADMIRNSNEYDKSSDDIFIYSTYHKSTNALQKGKYILWAGDKNNPIPLYEGDNPYDEDLPIFSLSPAEYMETSFGFTEANILRSAQTMLTLAVSAMATNLNAGGTNNIWSPKGSNLSVEKLSENMNHIQSDVKPEVVTFYQENPNLVNMLQICTGTMETLSGQNAVIRGNVKDTPNLKSGIALATVINQAQEYSQALQIGYYELFEDVFTFLLKTLKRVASTERVYEISGRSRKTASESFTSKDLEGVSRVVVNRVNPIAKTPAGKIEIATELLKLGVITPTQYFDVIDTGNLDVATESDERLLDYIAAVKEKLLAGETVPPIPGINHQEFIREIQSLLYDIELISDPDNAQIVNNIITLVNGHMEIVRNGDELSALIFGGQMPTPRQVQANELESGSLPPGQPGLQQQTKPTNALQGPAGTMRPPMNPPL